MIPSPPSFLRRSEAPKGTTELLQVTLTASIKRIEQQSSATTGNWAPSSSHRKGQWGWICCRDGGIWQSWVFPFSSFLISSVFVLKEKKKEEEKNRREKGEEKVTTFFPRTTVSFVCFVYNQIVRIGIFRVCIYNEWVILMILPIITTGTWSIFKMVEPINISDNNLPWNKLRY